MRIKHIHGHMHVKYEQRLMLPCGAPHALQPECGHQATTLQDAARDCLLPW